MCQGIMKKIISASRRTDLVAFFPEWLASAISREEAKVFGPSGYTYRVDLSPQNVHTVVLWSKNFTNLIDNKYGLRAKFRKYDQLYLHFTITGLGGSFIEQGVHHPDVALLQLDSLIEIVGVPRRVSVRFDPVIYWKEGDKERTNLHYFEEIAPILQEKGIQDIRFSFTQWYSKAKRRASKEGFDYVDPPLEKIRQKECYGYGQPLPPQHSLDVLQIDVKC